MLLLLLLRRRRGHRRHDVLLRYDHPLRRLLRGRRGWLRWLLAATGGGEEDGGGGHLLNGPQAQAFGRADAEDALLCLFWVVGLLG